MADIVILGGGFGGVAAAVELAARSGNEHVITVVDRRDSFQMGLAKLWTLVGLRGPEAGRGDLNRLAAKGIRFVQGECQPLDPAPGAVTVALPGGERREIRYDALVVAAGAETAPEAVPGLPAANNLYDPAAVPGLRDRLAGMKQGKIAVVVVKPPYKCPPAPYEAALLVDHALTRRGTRAGFEIVVYIPEKLPLTVAGPEVGAAVKAFVEGRGVRVETGRTLERIEAQASGIGTLHFAGGVTRPYDLLLAVPAHRVPAAAAGLADESGWIPVDGPTLATRYARIWAVGDVTAVKLPGGGQLPKAGIFAEAEGKVVAEQILARFEGRPAEARFDGAGQCWFETGGGQAMAVRGAFFGEPAGRVTLSEPSAATFREKEAFERDRLQAWFG